MLKTCVTAEQHHDVMGVFFNKSIFKSSEISSNCLQIIVHRQQQTVLFNAVVIVVMSTGTLWPLWFFSTQPTAYSRIDVAT